MSNEPNKPIEAEELTEKELEGVNGGRIYHDEASYELSDKWGGESFKSKGPF